MNTQWCPYFQAHRPVCSGIALNIKTLGFAYFYLLASASGNSLVAPPPLPSLPKHLPNSWKFYWLTLQKPLLNSSFLRKWLWQVLRRSHQMGCIYTEPEPKNACPLHKVTVNILWSSACHTCQCHKSVCAFLAQEISLIKRIFSK